MREVGNCWFPGLHRWSPLSGNQLLAVGSNIPTEEPYMNVLKHTLASHHRALNHYLQERRMMITAHHNPGRSSIIFSRIPVRWLRNQCPPILSILETFHSDDLFQRCALSFWWRSILSSHLSLGLLLVYFTSYLTAPQPRKLTLPLSPCHGQTIEVCYCRLLEQCVALLVSMIPPTMLAILLPCTFVVIVFKLSHSQWNSILPSLSRFSASNTLTFRLVPWPEQFPALIQSHSTVSGHACVVSPWAAWALRNTCLTDTRRSTYLGNLHSPSDTARHRVCSIENTRLDPTSSFPVVIKLRNWMSFWGRNSSEFSCMWRIWDPW